MTEAINELIEIQEFKILMKSINVKVAYKGFENKFVKTDKKRLQQVLLNLYSNAVKFTDRNGKITILVELMREQAQLRISVHDTGIGIKEED